MVHGLDATALAVLNLNNPSHLITSQKQSENLSLFSEALEHPPLPPALGTKCQMQLHSVQHFFWDNTPLNVDFILQAQFGLLALEYTESPTPSSIPPGTLHISPKPLLLDYPLALKLKEPTTSSTALVPASPSLIRADSDPSLFKPSVELDLPPMSLDLSQFTVLEPMSREVILQSIVRLQQTHPFIRLYHHKLTGSLVVALFSGCTEGGDRVSHLSWDSHLHTQVSFRNYYKHMASIVGGAVDTAVQEDTERKERIEEERQELIEARMKALKAEQEAREEEEAKQASAKSGKKTPSKTPKKTPASGRKSAASKVESPLPEMDLADESLPKYTERMLYVGYDIGDRPLVADGTVDTVFTSDGACITSQLVKIVEASIQRQVSLRHKELTLTAVSMETGDIPPVLQEIPSSEPENTQNSEEVGKPPSPSPEDELTTNPIPQPPANISFSLLKGTIGDDLHFSFSHFGPEGNGKLPTEPQSAKILEKLQQRPESAKDSRPPSQGGKLSKKQQEEQQRLLEQQEALEAKLAEERREAMKNFQEEQKAIVSRHIHQQLSLSTNQGLKINCSHVTTPEDDSVMIKQEFVKSPSDIDPATPVTKETSRTYLCQGYVVKHMKDGSTVILCGNGSIYESAPPSMAAHYNDLLATLMPKSPVVERESSSGNPSVVERDTSSAKVCFSASAMDAVRSSTPHDTIWVLTEPKGTRHVFKYVQVPVAPPTQQTRKKERSNLLLMHKTGERRQGLKRRRGK